MTGFEPATSWSLTRRSSQAEPHPDAILCNRPFPHFRLFSANPMAHSSSTFQVTCSKKAGDGNRTHVSSLEGWCSTIELHPHKLGVTGFEPATSWSQTRRSSQTEPHPVLFHSEHCLVYDNFPHLSITFLKNYKYFNCRSHTSFSSIVNIM